MKESIWTPDNEKRLKKHYGNNSNAWLAEYFNTTATAIRKKASRLGLRKAKKYLKRLRRK